MGNRFLMVNAGYNGDVHDELGCILSDLSTNVRIETVRCGDIFASYDMDIPEYDMYIISSLDDAPWERLVMLSVLGETLKRRHAHSITLIVPIWTIVGMRSANYTGTARSDSSRTLTRILDGSGIDRIVTFTPSRTLRSPLFPIEVIRPECTDIFRCIMGREDYGTPLLIAADADMMVSAKEFAREGSLELAVNQFAFHHCGITAEVEGRDVILYSKRLSDGMLSYLEEEVLNRNPASCRIFAPAAGMSAKDTAEFAERSHVDIFTFHDPGLDRISDSRLILLPTDRVMSEWIQKDIMKRGLIHPGT